MSEWNFEERIHTAQFPISTDIIGGTEFMREEILKMFVNFPKFRKYNLIMMPGLFDKRLIEESKVPIIFWMHNNMDQLNDYSRYILENTKHITKFYVVLSQESKNEILKQIDIDANKIVIIPNAFNPLTYNPLKFEKIDKIKIMHVSAPERGMALLLDSLEYIDEDFDLKIFNHFNPDLEHEFNKYKHFKDDRVTFYGRTPRQTVYKYFEKSHIHAYPSVYNETFCLSQAEAMSAGCLCVYRFEDGNALKSTSGGYGIGYTDNPIDPKNYAEKLKEGIQMIKNKQFNPKEQIEYINNSFNWEIAKKNWHDLHERI